MTPRHEAYRQILQTLDDGVMAISDKGEIVVFNHVASRLLELPEQDVLGKRLAEVFFTAAADNDEFVQAVLNSVQHKNETCRVSAPYLSPHGTKRFLEIATSFLDEKFKGVVVVFKDVTTYRDLYEQEKQLTTKLGEAYRSIEEHNQAMASKATERRFRRRMTLAFVTLLLLIGGAFLLYNEGFFETDQQPAAIQQATQGDNTVAAYVAPVSLNVSLIGHFEPRSIVNLVTPFTGKIAEKFVDWGQEVQAGAPLVRLDVSELQVQLRKAEAEVIKAKQDYQKIRDWEESDDVHTAQRDFVRSKMALDSVRARLESSRDLLTRGIIPQDEFDNLQQEYENKLLDYTSSKEKLDSVKQRGAEENLRIAEMALQNAKFIYADVRSKIEAATVTAPVTGLVIPSTAVESDKQRALEVGASFNEGEIILAIGDLEGFTVRTKADEVDMVKLKVGQPVHIRSDALPDIELAGTIKSISLQAATRTENSDEALFDVVVSVAPLPHGQRERIRLGMIAVMEVTTYSNPEAVLVPIAAVYENGGSHYVRVQNASGIEERKVQTGLTTLDAVEIKAGLRPGELILTEAP